MIRLVGLSNYTMYLAISQENIASYRQYGYIIVQKEDIQILYRQFNNYLNY